MHTTVRLSQEGFRIAAIRRIALWGTLLAITFAGTVAEALTLTAVQSRKTHGAASFDLPIDTSQTIGGAVTVEPRVIGSGHQIVFQFDLPVTFGVATAVDEAGASVVASAVAGGNNDIVVTLTGVPDNKRVTVLLPNVKGVDFSASLGLLVGNVSNSRVVSDTDVSQVKARAGQVADGSNFRFDLNTSGAISAADISAVKGRVGRTLPVATAVITYTLNVSKTGAGNGTVSSSPAGITCGANCTKNYNAATIVTLTATASSGSTFSAWGGACAGSGTCIVTMNAATAVSANFTLNPIVIPPDPATVATPIDPTVATNITTATAFLYTVANPIQTGVAPGTIEARRTAILRGKVQTRDGVALSGVTITILAHPEFGQTVSRVDGAFDLAVNGGGQLTVNYQKSGFLPVQRAVVAPWRDYAWLPDVVMIPFDTAVTTVDLTNASMQTARGSPVTDADGARRATILFPAGTTAVLVLPDGSTQPLTTLNVRATEYTVGASGPKAMPAPLPPNSGYTYAVELSIDEAVAAGATEVRFSQPVPTYVENFLGFPVGGAVPAGYYDRQKGQWIASANGRVIKVLGITTGLADLDTDGDAVIDDSVKLAAIGITDSERARLAQLYAAGQTLWRIPITHFTPWDFNWPFGPPQDAIPPPGWSPYSPIDDPCITFGSVIGCENQSLGQALPVTGTPWQLNYRSERTPGRKETYQLDIRVSGATIPASLTGIVLVVEVAGQRYVRGFAPTANLIHTFNYDGKDAFGRTLQGPQLVKVRTGYTYKGVYLTPSQIDAALASAPLFGHFSYLGSPATGNRERMEVTLWQESNTRVGPWDNRALGLGGWSLSNHHAYDQYSRKLLLGDGRQRSAEAIGRIITTVAGNGTFGFTGDGGPATTAQLSADGVAVGPDGSLYIAGRGAQRIRRVGPDGIITTVAGNGTPGFSGDGGPATAAQLNYPNSVVVGLDGSLFISDEQNHRIRRIGPDGIITTVAGTGASGFAGGGFSGDGGPATAAKLYTPSAVAVGPDGSLYIADTNNNRIRRVGPDGIITTVAGNSIYAGFSGDGGPATAAQLSSPRHVAVGPDGSLYIADTNNSRFRRVAPDGIIATLAGTGVFGSSGDGGSATAAQLAGPEGIALEPDGSFYIVNAQVPRIRLVAPDGTISTIAGNGVAGFSGDGGPAAAAKLQFPGHVVVGPDGSLYFADRSNSRIRRVQSALPGGSVADSILAADDGREVYVFNSSGRHLRTLDSLTGAVRHQFSYDATGYLTSITDGSGNVTVIERTGALVTAIVAPGGQRTTLNVNANGWLLSAANPASQAHTMTYSTDGLMQSFTDPRGNIHLFTYDVMGRLTKDEDPIGGSTSLARTAQSTGHTVTVTSALGRTRSFQVERLPTGAVRRTVTARSGATTVTVSNTNGTQAATYPDGSQITATLGSDPRFGMLAPRLVQRVRTVPGGPTETVTASRSVTLADPDNILSLATLTDTVSVNGRSFSHAYAATTRTMTDLSAEGRRTISILDTQGRVVSRTIATGILPITVTYDGQGRVTATNHGTQGWSYGYDALNRVVSRTDAAGRSVTFEYDAADRIVKRILPNGAALQFTYDANGNRTQVILPSGASHTLAYTPIDRDAAYTPPGNGSYLRTHNVDRQLTRTTLPGGRFTDQSYDTLGRVNGLSFAEGAAGFEYLAGDLTDRVARITNTAAIGPAQDIAYSYNGGLISGMTATGAAPAAVSYTYDNNYFPTAMNLTSGADTVSSALLWDTDGLVTGFGPFTFTRGGPKGAVSRISDTASATNYTYDTLARIATRSHQVNALPAYAIQLSHDNSGRITGKTETLGGTTYIYAYTYDLNGQLTDVRRDGVLVERYTYDLNGNRTGRQLGAGPLESASYDSQDRLIQRGAVAYQFNADGFLTQRGADTFQYSTRGQLIAATVGGQANTYAYDGLGRRVSRTNASGTFQYLYGDPASHLVTAVRAPGGGLTSLYYNTAGMLIALERGGAKYYVATDQVGTPKVVTDNTGAVIKTLEADSFGNVTSDSNPAFELPIGYAGGLADSASGLVHFSFRDYDPAAGRWTTRDPILFSGGQGNLYAYVKNSPVGHRDPSGLFCVSVTVYEGVGGGVGVCITDEGASVCGEIGFGVGASVGADIGGDLEKTGAQLVAEASYQIGPAKIGAGVSLDSSGCLGATGKGQLGPITAEIDSSGDPSKAGLDLDIEGSPKIGGGAEAKIAAKGCVQGKF